MKNEFEGFFTKITGNPRPYDYQKKLADGKDSHMPTSRMICIPTGLGKTAAVILAWVWNRIERPNSDWPRRLVFCLPMRTLVEQTFGNAYEWLNRLNKLWDGGMNTHEGRVGLHMLMGGEMTEGWEQFPEENAILIGTQDMLLSRALNRGYGMSRFRWPLHYGLLNNDCLWVFDEVQLMGAGLPTTTQLAGFRKQFGMAKNCYTWWMSATSDPRWLRTVDFDPTAELGAPIFLEEKEKLAVSHLLEAKKTIGWCDHDGDDKALLLEILAKLEGRKGLSLIVVNTVDRARILHEKLKSALQKSSSEIEEPILLHSHFRPEDRKRQLAKILEAEGQDQIVVSTQIVEAGVDLSAATLFTELAPWSALVQRFGRCNRRGIESNARIFLIEPSAALPYEEVQLEDSKQLVTELLEHGADASPASLEKIQLPASDQPVSRHVIRRRDFIDLFDTTPDLAGQDIDIERWVREIEDSKVQLFWREWEGCNKGAPPQSDFAPPARNELCPAPIGAVKSWIKKEKLVIHNWEPLAGEWRKQNASQILPGRIYLLATAAGGYDESVGFSPAVKTVVPTVGRVIAEPDSTEAERISKSSVWQSIAVHTDAVCDELRYILLKLNMDSPSLLHAARWHDLGKVHRAFQAKIRADSMGDDFKSNSPVAKAPDQAWRYPNDHSDTAARKYFRHELASALAVLQPGVGDIPEDMRDLVAWLIATHHGKIRLSIRSLPKEKIADDGRRFARGVWDHDSLIPVDLGGGVTTSEIKLSLEPMELGLGEKPPFIDQPSWTERMLSLRDHSDIGPLRLAYWECLLRAADERASAKATITQSETE